MWDGSNAGTLTSVAGGSQPATEPALTTASYTVTAANITAGLDHVVFRFGHDIGWGEAADATLRVLSNSKTPVTDLAITGPISDSSQMILSWTSELNGIYSVETNSNLVVPNWGSWTNGISGNGGTVACTNTIGAGGQIFYRCITE